MRATAYQNCFTPSSEKVPIAEYRPLFYWTDEDKKLYAETFGVIHSRCYTEYGLKRTGCAGCPLSSNFEEELKIIKHYEPKLYKAITNIFGESYTYYRGFRRYKEERNKGGTIP